MVFTIIDSFIYGTCTLDSLGQLIYTNNTFFGNETNYIDELTYLICNGINCDTASVFIYITGNFECDSLQIFNAISPNGDQINDVFIIPCSYAHIDNRLMIFNRWGQLVFDESKYQNNWSGEWQNTKIKVPSGTYYYIFEKNQFKNEPNNRLSGFLYIK
jgi:gliding motility-associated-like protein